MSDDQMSDHKEPKPDGPLNVERLVILRDGSIRRCTCA